MGSPRAAGRRHGFTLIEMMVAVVVGALAVVVAAKVAQVVIRQSKQGQQSTDFNARARLFTRQIRMDLRAAGYGSTGAVAVDNTRPPWVGMTIQTTNNKPAIAVVAGANNIAGPVPVGPTAIRADSDAMMLVVPNPGIFGLTDGWNQQSNLAINLAPPPMNPLPVVQPLASCATGYVYIVDNTAPNGAGRVQLARFVSVVNDVVTLADSLQFTLAPGSSVMCARLSTYWVDVQGWLHRTDFGPAPTPQPIGGLVWIDTSRIAQGFDLLAPGVIDLQIAYRFSSELYLNEGLVIPPPTVLDAQWAFEDNPNNVDGYLGPRPQHWFEVRRVRLNALLTSLREVDPRNFGQKERAFREDGQPSNVNRPLRAEWTTTTEALTNLRYFDYGAPQGVVAEPY